MLGDVDANRHPSYGPRSLVLWPQETPYCTFASRDEAASMLALSSA